jgi:hypothetical protein
MYLIPGEARQKLINRGIYTEEAAPNVALIESLMEEIEPMVDNWFGARLVRTSYSEILFTNEDGNAITTYYPILSLTSVERVYRGKDAQGQPNPPTPIVVDLELVWIGEIRTLRLGGESVSFRVNYEAGYDPVPAAVSNAVWSLLKHVLLSPEQDTSSLYEMRREAKSIELPGDLRKSFFSPSEMGGNGSDGNTNVIDLLLHPAKRYRRNHTAIGAGLL